MKYRLQHIARIACQVPVVVLLFLGVTQSLFAQRHEIFKDNIRSLQVVADNKWTKLPVIKLHHGTISVSFDDLTHEYHRYMYKVEHCEADWTVSNDLFESDYIDGFASGNTIDDVRESLLTNTLYTNYRLTIPNRDCRLKLSGNYKLTVYDDNADEEPVLTACFMVVEPIMGLSLSVTTNTDIDINNSHQQVGMEINYNGISVPRPQEQIKTVVLQNRRWDNARWNTPAQYVMPDGLRWNHNRDLIFDAGNEYHKFEILSTKVASMGIDSLSWDGQQFHAFPFINEPRPNYIYDEDANGAFLLRNSDNTEARYTSDYMMVHFRLKTTPSSDTAPSANNQQSSIYVNGDWTYDSFLPKYRMTYNPERKQYETAVPLKLGYYSFQYLLVGNDGTVAPLPSEGNYYQTENTYQALIYYRQQGGRTDQLVACQDVTTR